MKTIILFHQRLGLLSNRTLPLDLIDEAHPVLKMLHPRLSRTDLMVLVEVGGRRDGPILVECKSFVRNGQVKYPSGFQNAEMVCQRTDGILAVFDEVIGDDEILRAIRNSRERLAVVYNVHLDQIELRKLWVLLA